MIKVNRGEVTIEGDLNLLLAEITTAIFSLQKKYLEKREGPFFAMLTTMANDIVESNGDDELKKLLEEFKTSMSPAQIIMDSINTFILDEENIKKFSEGKLSADEMKQMMRETKSRKENEKDDLDRALDKMGKGDVMYVDKEIKV